MLVFVTFFLTCNCIWLPHMEGALSINLCLRVCLSVMYIELSLVLLVDRKFCCKMTQENAKTSQTEKGQRISRRVHIFVVFPENCPTEIKCGQHCLQQSG